MLEDLIEHKLEKLKNYQKKSNPYPSDVERDYSLEELRDSFDSLIEKDDFYIAGRITAIRDQGKIVFVDIDDGTSEIQIVLKAEEAKDFEFIKESWDKGDFIQVYGSPFRTNRGEESVLGKEVKIISKSLRPWPSSWYGLQDKEKRMRHRYMDLFLNEEAREVIETRFEITSKLRSILERDDFKKVETPILQPIPGGATAKPFQTHF
ncbi:MAG: OB-fold nucleic acid binding domain-containing protein, partial [Candidatus Magasanikbacteria bacterium]